MYRILTYSDPFTLDRQEYWEEIRKYPHICASHTLVLGLCRFYGRQNFSFICSADDLLEAFYHNWNSSVRNDIIRQISLSEIISQFEPNIANIFRKNKYQLFRSLKFLIELDIEPSYFELNGLSPAERNFLELYKIIRQKPIWQIDEVDENQFDSKLKDALLEIFFTEVDNNCLQNENNINYKNIIKNKDLEELKNLLNSFLAGEDDDQFIDLSLGLTEEAGQEGGIGSYLDALENVQMLLENRITKIVFHGIHHLQPLMMRFLDELQRKGIEVIFLIPYSKKYSQIYKTWERVYSWTNINFNDFEDTEEVKLNEFSAALVNLFKSGAIGYTSKKIKRFSDITHLTNYIGFIYEKAKRRATEKKQSALANMEEQFYAVKASDLNDMLKNYYPEQFGQRHFLAYPVGQFILAIYNMWENGKYQELIIDEANLQECLSFNIWGKSVQTTPYEIFDKIRLYIKDVNKVTDCIKRLEELKEDLKKIKAMEDSELSENLRRFSFFGLTEEEIDYFINILDELNTLAKKIFEGSDSGRINFTEHFKRLLQQLQEKLEKYEDKDVLRQVKSFLESLLERLEGATDMEGGIEDLKEAIFYYLNVLEQKNNSNWIVRGFEQLDGGIILSEGRTGAEKYHLCLLSDQMLEKRAKDMFSWPLSDSFFKNYRGRKDHLEAVLTSIREYENFIIYSIFYSACYCKKKLIISYCQEDSELNKHSPLFIFRIMGLEEDEAGEIQLANEILKPKQNDFKYKSLTYEFPGEVENYEAFLICPFRFFLNHVFDKDKIYYTDEFQCNYYLTLVVRDAFWRSYRNGDRKEEIEKNLEELYNKIKPLLKFWNNFTLADIYNKTLHDVEEFCFDKKQIKDYDKRYMTRKLKLLMWKIDGCNVHLDPVDKLHDKIEKYFSTNDYSFEKKSTELCVYCNQNDYCILRYLDGE